jgi:hypothetical protein
MEDRPGRGKCEEQAELQTSLRTQKGGEMERVLRALQPSIRQSAGNNCGGSGALLPSCFHVTG